MIELPRLLSVEDLGRLESSRTVAWVTPSVRSIVAERLPLRIIDCLQAIPEDCRTLVAIGGGALLDQAKYRVKHELLLAGRRVELIAVPSIWGSGAEASKIAVLDHKGKKEIHIEARLIPDTRAIWEQLALSVPHERAMQACGDAWSHAVEGFCSPLAPDALRSDLAAVIQKMLIMPLGNDPGWFELSALACAGQSMASVGLIHGIAHVLEQPLRGLPSEKPWHHARLCALFLAPVLAFNAAHGEKWQKLCQAHEIDSAAVMDVARGIFDQADYDQTMPLLAAHWKSVLRDPCTRTNSVLVRPDSLQFFLSWRAS